MPAILLRLYSSNQHNDLHIMFTPPYLCDKNPISMESITIVTLNCTHLNSIFLMYIMG